MTEILLAGESWITVRFEIKGKNVISDSTYGEAADHLISVLEGMGATVEFQPCHVAAEQFPRTREALDEYDLVILSDVGADTLQITPQVAAGETDADRLALLDEYVRDGGALGMVGGYMSFAGKSGQARYGRTSIADVLPVDIALSDDRVEAPSGIRPESEGPLAEEFPDTWPTVLGYNQFEATADAEVWATVGDDPFLVVGDYGEGNAFAFASDCAPHWAPEPFLAWEDLPRLWKRIVDRTTGGDA